VCAGLLDTAISVDSAAKFQFYEAIQKTTGCIRDMLAAKEKGCHNEK
jgi:hypothetical protein